MTPSVFRHVLYELRFFYANDLPLCIKSPGETRGWLAIQSGRQPDTLFFFLSICSPVCSTEQTTKQSPNLVVVLSGEINSHLECQRFPIRYSPLLNADSSHLKSSNWNNSLRRLQMCLNLCVWPLIFKEKLRLERMSQWSCGWSWKRSRLSSAIGHRAVNFVVWDFFPFRKVMGTNNPPAVPR